MAPAAPSHLVPDHLPEHVTHESGRRKTVCVSACLAHFGIAPSAYRYAGELGQLEAILRRHGFSVRSRFSKLPKTKGKWRCTVGQARKAIAKFSGDPDARFYVSVWGDNYGHAMILDGLGRTLVDTDPRERDRRKVRRLKLIERK